MKSSSHSLIPFLPLFCNCQFSSSTPKLISRQAGVSKLEFVLYCSWQVKSQSYVTTDGSIGQSVLVSSTHLGLTTRSLLLSDSCRIADVGRSLWREDGSVVCQTRSAVLSLLSVCAIFILQVIKCMYIQHIQGLCQFRHSTAVQYISSSCYHSSL
jgi:hypothetical protein